jgi:Domain of unknown function (DUF1985)
MFRRDIFGHFLIMESFSFSGAIVHNLLLRQVAVGDDDQNQLWFKIRGQYIRLSIAEWCLVTGLNCGGEELEHNPGKKNRLLKKYFGNCSSLSLKELDERFMFLDFKGMKDLDALKIALYYFADRVLFGRKSNRAVDMSLLQQADDIDYFRNRPWGTISWNVVFNTLHSVLEDKVQKFKMAKAENPAHKEEKYNVYGLAHAVQVRNIIYLFYIFIHI